MIVFMAYSDILADIRVRFKSGATSATLKGQISKKVCFIAGASQGQSMDAIVSGGNNKVVFEEGLFWNMSWKIDRSGDKRFCIINNGSQSTYEMTVHIE